MKTLEIFFSMWSPISMISLEVVMIGFWLWERFAHPRSSFLWSSPKSFKELTPYSAAEQNHLLQVAQKEMLSNWWSIFLPITLALVVSILLPLGSTLQKVTQVPDTWWTRCIFAGLSAYPACWPYRQLEVRCTRPFVRRLLIRT